MSRIVFYDVEDQEREIFEESFSDAKIVQEEISVDNVDTEAEVISLFVSSKATKEILDKMPNLKFIACRSTGFDNVDKEVVKERGIQVSNVPTYGSHTVAEYAFALLLSLTRRVSRAEEAVDEGENERAELTGVDLYGKTFGVIGAGNIGRNVAKIAKGFGMKVLAYDKFPNEEHAKECGFEYADLDVVVSSGDFISLHTPLTDETKHLMNAERLSSMKEGAFLVNTARGELVDTGALIESLKSGHLAGAALDVLEGEALMCAEEELALLRSEDRCRDKLEYTLEISILTKMSNVIITHHNAYNSREAVDRINNTTVDNIKSFNDGQAENVVL